MVLKQFLISHTRNSFWNRFIGISMISLGIPLKIFIAITLPFFYCMLCKACQFLKPYLKPFQKGKKFRYKHTHLKYV